MATAHHRAELEAPPYGSNEVVHAGSYEMLNAQSRMEIDIQIATAKRWPRSIQNALQEAETLATLDKDVAKSCWYSLKRKDKDAGTKLIEGPSVRLAEIFAYSWGNLRTGTRISGETDRFVIAQSGCIDLEKNIGFTAEVRRRISYSNGGRYNDDMIATTANAASSIAFRNAVFRLIPLSYVNRILSRARATAIGSGETIEELRDQWIGHWESKGVRPEELFRALEVKGKADITIASIETMIGFDTAIKDGETSLDSIFRPVAPEAAEVKPGTKSDRLAESIKTPAKSAAKEPAKEPAAAGEWTEGRQ